ncbi:MAG: GNAT family N-acetyltransferase, partial [Hyphomicrobiaceae bacterium]
MTVRIEPLTGAGLAAALPALAELRIKVFRAWPYLYEGTLEYEQKYLRNFASAMGAILVAARDGHPIVGVATASPITGHMEAFAAPFKKLGYDLGRLFY